MGQPGHGHAGCTPGQCYQVGDALMHVWVVTPGNSWVCYVAIGAGMGQLWQQVGRPANGSLMQGRLDHVC